MKSTLDINYLDHSRRSGNTTRQVDYAIQKLFEDNEVLIIDHYSKPDGGTRLNYNLNKSLLDRICNRLQNEHHLTKENFIINKTINDEFILKLNYK